MFIDPIIISWLLIAAASACAFMIGKTWGQMTREEIIESTIMYMIENNFVKAKKVDGEWELLDLNSENNC